MPLYFFRVPVVDAEPEQNKLNRLLAQQPVLDVEKQLITDGQKSYWAICVTTATTAAVAHSSQPRVGMELGGKKRTDIDYKEVLSPEDFSVYAALRELRKKVADNEGVPAYVVFTNAQLASMVTEKVSTKKALALIEGIGQARVDKHADAFVKCLIEARASLAAVGRP